MSDRDDGREDEDEGEEPGEDPHLDTEETSGLGLTDEFARIESEIEGEAPNRREVRFDETDSGEFVAPLPAGAGRETDEWAAEDSFEAEDGGTSEPEGDVAPDPGNEPAPDPEPEIDPAEAETDPPEEADAPAEPPAPPAPVDAPAAEHTVVRERPLVPRSPASVMNRGTGGGGATIPPLQIDGDLEDKTPALWWRFLMASIVIIVRGGGIAVQRHRHLDHPVVFVGPGRAPCAGEEPRIYHRDSMHVTIAYCVR